MGATSPADCTISCDSTNEKSHDCDLSAPEEIIRRKQERNQKRKQIRRQKKEESRKKKRTEDDEKNRKGSLLWVQERLTNTDEMALKALRRWANRQRSSEVRTELLLQLRGMDKEVQKEVLRELKRPRTWIRKVNQNAVITPILISTLTDRHTFDIKALLDSGATGCYIDEGFARAKGLTLESLPHPIPVYNADGSHNEGGPIRTIVKLRLQIADHIEVFTFAVTNTGKTDMIIGYDWLRKHNPSINWRMGHLTFNCCPLTCYQSTSCSKDSEPEDDIKRTQKSESIGLEEGDRLFVTKLDPGSVKDPYWEKVYE